MVPKIPSAPIGHPISIEEAKRHMAGDLADVYRDILKKCCAPLYWFNQKSTDRRILNNATVTFVQTPEILIGVTAAHVVQGFIKESADSDLTLMLMNYEMTDFLGRIIDVSDKYDLATIRLDAELLSSIGKELHPLQYWPPMPPQEGRGIMLAGYPAVERNATNNSVEFGLFTALVSARTVTDTQITWLIEPDARINDAKVPAPPSQYNLGGISGGPLITWLETESHFSMFALGGIIKEHPDYESNNFSIERVITARADLINPSGRIHG